jgi:hypothetical protein
MLRILPVKVLLLALLTGCASQVVSVPTERAVCRELARDLPTYSAKDTPETLESGARFIEVFESVCKDFI